MIGSELEKGWATCVSCECRRPAEKLKNGRCADGWCERVTDQRRQQVLALFRSLGMPR